jgi:hypothetical protein
MTTDQPLVRRKRRSAWPAVSEIERLINQARAIRIALSPLANHELCGPIVTEAITSLQAAGSKLEQLVELTAVAQSRRRRRPTNKPMTNT